MQTIVIGIKKMLTTTDALAEWQLAMATAVLAMLSARLGGGVHAAPLREGPGRDARNKARWLGGGAKRHADNTPVKTYAGNFEAIKGIALDIGDGSFCVLVGPPVAASPRFCA